MARIIDDPEGLAALCRGLKRVAVLGAKIDAQVGQPAVYVPQYLKLMGIEIVPVPVYFPDATTILGEKVYRDLRDVPGELDLVDVFRRSEDVPRHLEELLAKRPKAVWMQLGIENEEVAVRLVTAGIDVVQNRCLMVEYRRAMSG